MATNFTTKPITDLEFQQLLTTITPYSVWHPGLVELKKQHPKLGYGGVFNPSTGGHQMVNFLAHYPQYMFSREQLEQVSTALGVVSRDIIQLVNKSDQKGLKRFHETIRGTKYYFLPVLEYDPVHVEKRVDTNNPDWLRRMEEVSREWFRQLSVDSYEAGHRDPDLPLAPENTVMQPSKINRSHKAHFKFDERGLPRCPTANHLATKVEVFYPREEERLTIATAMFNSLSADKKAEFIASIQAG